ncbi:hypothetical protein BGX23_001535 [Mortierella sp. AD031]|nr:hypothetical protein BGX23_001535 [Mortierella sp. AD031]
MQLQSTQRHLFQQQRQQHRYELRKRNPAPQNQQGQRQDTNQSTLLHVMEHLQNLIDAYQSTLYLLDKAEAAFPTPWFIDSAEDEQQLIDFMDRAPRLKAFGSDSLMLSNHQVLQSIGQRWSDLRVLSLMVLKCSVFQPGQRHVELNSLFNRCPSRLESLQLSFSSNAVYRLLSNDIFKETHKNNNDNAEGGEGGSVVVSVCPPLPEILTLRRVFIEANLGAFSGTNVPTHFEDEHSWINLLRRCPNLESLGLHSCSPAFFHLVANKAMDHWPLLQKFATYAIWTDFDSQLDQGIAALLNATRLPDDDETDSISSSTTSSSYLTGRVGMKKVRLDRIALTIQSATLQSLFRLSKTLTHLSLRNCQITGGSPSEALLRILRACDRLEEVDLLPSGGHYLAIIMMLEAKHFVKFLSLETDTPWPSAQILRVLRVTMIGFNRPLSGSNSAVISSAASSSSSSYWSTVLQHTTATTTALSPWELTMLSGRPSQLQYQRGTASASLTSVPVHSPLEALYGLQGEVCQILGSFTSLEELTLGVQADKDPMGALIPQMYQQTKCLELMLESGLNLMGGLKRLRVLNIPRMAHRIGLHELVWMRHQWPRLRVVEGLLRVENMKCQRAGLEALFQKLLEGPASSSTSTNSRDIQRAPKQLLPIHLAKWVAAEVAKSLAHMHGLSIMHRDLKPANPMKTEEGIKIRGFGMVRSWLRDQKNGYCGSEVENKSEAYGLAADIYSLGVLIRELVSGEGPKPDLQGISAHVFISSLACTDGGARLILSESLAHPFVKDAQQHLTDASQDNGLESHLHRRFRLPSQESDH